MKKLLLFVTLCVFTVFMGCDKKMDAKTPPPPSTPPAATASAGQPVPPMASPDDSAHIAAIFTANHADKNLDDKLATMEDFISSRITEKGFSVISREAATTAASAMLKDSKQTEIDRMLGNNASAVRLAQMLGANYIIMASISSYAVDKKTVDAYGVKTITATHNMRVTYKVLEGKLGGTLAGNVCKASKEIQYTENKREEPGDLLNDLLDQVSQCVVDDVATKSIKTVVASSNLAEFSVACSMQDNAQLPLSVPDVRLTENNTVVVGNNQLPVLALNVMVELDGAGIGSTPASFKVSPGLHKIRLRRDGFTDYEGTITVYQGQVFNVALQMTDAGYQRWKDNSAFLNHLKNGDKLTEAEAEKIKGEAQMLRQSGNLVNVKVDTKEGTKVYKSIY